MPRLSSIQRAALTAACALASSAFPSTAPLAQGSDSARTARPAPDSSSRITRLSPVGVTATRREASVFNTTVPVLIIDADVVRAEYPNGIGDLFRNLPGVDVTGIGPNQGRLIIRGQRGQRILLAEDGLRLNNSRRQADFGEIPALTGVNDLQRVEVVRGPASVLYGTDAIGGVVNQLTLGTPPRGRDGLEGTTAFRHSDADGQHATSMRIAGREGRVGFALSGTMRDAANYEAPAGTFGELTLGEPAVVHDAGVRDANVAAAFSLTTGASSELALRLSHYDAADAGFGYVDPAAWGEEGAVLVRLRYPDQAATRGTLSWRANALSHALADRVSVAFAAGGNDRTFHQAIDIPFTPTAGMNIRTTNETDVRSYGLRVEAAKVIGGRTALTYGADAYLDRSANSDSSETTMFGFGPTTTTTDTTPNVPNARYLTSGAFAQAEVTVTPRLMVGAGARGQLIEAETRRTPGLPEDRSGVHARNAALVGHVNGRYRLTPSLNLVAAVGRAFRAPNLIERYFEGATPEGNGYQMASPDLAPETSLNVDVGLKLRRGPLYAEATYFINTISDGIRIAPQDTTIDGSPAFRNENVERLRDRGVEALASLSLPRGFSMLAHMTTLSSRNVDREIPIGDSYGRKLGAELAWRDAGDRLGVAYEVRHQGRRRDAGMTGSPVGEELPAFTVQNVSARWRIPVAAAVRPTLTLAVHNVADVLYAEASNTSFFRPEPGRSVLAAMRLDF